MNGLIIVVIDKIKDEALRGAVLRLYNNLLALLKSAIATVIAYLSYYFLENGMPTTFKELVNAEMWESAIVVMLLVMLGIASLDKYTRVTKSEK
jgi:hypothetical protein